MFGFGNGDIVMICDVNGNIVDEYVYIVYVVGVFVWCVDGMGVFVDIVVLMKG